MKQLLIIHSLDPTTEFLYGIIHFLRENWGDKFEYLQITVPDPNLEQITTSIAHTKQGSTIIFLGHGASHSIYLPILEGGKPTSLITKTNFNILDGRNFIALSCRSSEFINNCFNPDSNNTMLGFDDLPTHWNDVSAEREVDPKTYRGITDDVLEQFREILVSVFCRSLYDAVSKNMDFNQFHLRLRLYINKQIFRVTNYDISNNSTLLANILYELKSGIKLFGDIRTPIIYPHNTQPV